MDLVFSDIHADISALESILSIATSNEFIKRYGDFSRIINLGDILERGTNPKQVLDKLKTLEKNYPVISVMGNHDEAFLYKRQVSGSSIDSIIAHEDLTQDDLSFFPQNNDGTLGKQLYQDKKNGLLCVHGGPIDPKKITPKNAYDESWLYQRSWQRLTQEEFEFFSYSGYHYTAESAFSEAKENNCHVILCGHQHDETAILQDGQIRDIYHKIETTREKTTSYHIEKREIEINPENNYLIRLGLGGPQGDYGKRYAEPHFGIIQYDPSKVILFTVKP
jgi:predicted MPP superfamily phosphohydrolase